MEEWRVEWTQRENAMIPDGKSKSRLREKCKVKAGWIGEANDRESVVLLVKVVKQAKEDNEGIELINIPNWESWRWREKLGICKRKI